ncbi:flippase [Neobacillus rhizophilus]|uniref:Flippase n=1 Tax=Neobacillus rhizophilus TaxID=2833579 RepID=A0A942U3S5_9BACI|nr:flippase [Neobacillus rhizophilus]MBS4212690.1 flippase [Neobacillus rhizophilus]
MSIKKNYLYNLIYQVSSIALPIITIPYVSRVLRPEGVGTYAYTNSIVNYFIILGMLGIGTYGNKMVAIARENKVTLSKTFFSIYCLQLVLTFISLVGYFVFIVYFFHDFKLIALLQSITLFATIIDCSWLFSGLEQFKKIVTRNMLIKIISLIAIFSFVKNQEDLVIYTIIMSLSSFLGQLIMWIYVKDLVVPVRISFELILKHFKPTFVYFLPQVAIQVYFVLNKTMLGVLSSNIEVGLYDYADKILKMSVAIVSSLGVVMLPRMANTFANGNLTKAKDYISKSLEFSTFLAIPIMFGIAGISEEMIPWYMGVEFYGSIKVLMILSPTIFLMAWTSVFGTQYLLPLGKMKIYTTSLYVGAIFNLIINFILIGTYGAIGAAIGTLCAELAVFVVQINYVRKDINIRRMIPRTIYYLIAGGVMYSIVKVLGRFMGSSIITTIVQILIGFLVYIGIVILFELLLKNGLIINEVKKKYN